MKNITFVFLIISLSFCSLKENLQEKTDKKSEKMANDEMLEIVTSDFFNENSDDYIIKPKVQFFPSKGKLINYWGYIDSFKVKNYEYSKISRDASESNNIKYSYKYEFDITDVDMNNVFCECRSKSRKKIFSSEEELECTFRTKGETYFFKISNSNDITNLSAKSKSKLKGSIKGTKLFITSTNNFKKYNDKKGGGIGRFLDDTMGYKIYKKKTKNKKKIKEEIIVVDSWKIRLLNSISSADQKILNISYGFALHQYFSLLDDSLIIYDK